MATLLQQAQSFGFATCIINFDALSKVVSISCKECNQAFANFLGKTKKAIINEQIDIPNYNLIAFLNAEDNAINQTMYSRDGKHYKIEVIRDEVETSNLMIIVTEVSQQIAYHNLQHRNKDNYETEKNSDALFIELLKKSEDAMLLYSGGEYIIFNDAAKKLLGYEGVSTDALDPIKLSPEFQPNGMSSAELSFMHNSKAMETGFNRFEWVHLKRDGTELLVEVSLSYVAFNGEPMLQCVWKDLTKVKALQKEVEEKQESVLNQLSIPITQVFKDILLLPLLGSISETRANNILQKVLKRIGSTQSKVLILDIGGIDDMNEVAAKHLIQLSKATKLMGCTTILSGVSGLVAETLANLNTDIQDINSAGTLENALYMGFGLLGINISFNSK